MSRRWVPTRHMSVNTHAGLALDWELPVLLGRHDPHVVYLQEVRGGADALAKFEGAWEVARADRNAILLHPRRYTVVDHITEDVAYGSRYARTVCAVVALDHWTMRLCVWSVAHPDPLGRGFRRADPRARARHTRQLVAQIAVLAPMKQIRHAQLGLGGDFNESVRNPDRGAVTPTAWRMARLRPAHRLARRKRGPVNIDEIYLGPRRWMKVHRRISYWARRMPQLDHPVTVVHTRVKKRRGWHWTVRRRWMR